MEVSGVLIHFLAQLGVISLALTTCFLARDRMSGCLPTARTAASGIVFGATALLLMHMPGELINEFRFDLRICPVGCGGLGLRAFWRRNRSSLASIGRIWLGGAGAILGFLGIWLAFGVAWIGTFSPNAV